MPTYNPVIANGNFVNPQGFTITGQNYGVYFGAAGSALNQGAVYAKSGDAFLMKGVSFVTNASTGIISGSTDGVFVGAAAHIYNTGALYGGVDGAYITGAANVYNYLGAVFSGKQDGVKVVGAGTVTNFGTFAASEGVGISLTGAALVSNDSGAAISAAAFGVDLTAAGTVVNDGLITALQGTGVYIGAAGHVINESGGNISGSLYGVHMLGTATVENAGIITGSSGLLGGAVVIGPSGGILQVDAGAVFQGNVADAGGAGEIELEASPSENVLDMGSSFSGFSEILFATGSTFALKGDTADLASSQVINGFLAGDTIDLEGYTQSSYQYVAGTGLELSNGNPAQNQILDITGAYTTPDFGVTNLADGSTQVVISMCYLRGTRLLTPGGEVLVEDLRIGDVLVTRWQGLQPIKWVGQQSFDSRFIRNNRDQIPVRIKAGALGENLPRRDLFVSPGHSMLVGGDLLLAKALVNGVTITQDEMPDEVHYYQVEFETHDCVLAEGTWSESFADGPGQRAKFDNAEEFYALYPGYRPPEELALCAPRPEKGARLEAALRPVAARAAAMARPGTLRGWMDVVRAPWAVEGWAWDEANPELPVLLEALLDGEVIGSLLACAYREDLAEAGFGAGRCAFFWTAPVTLPTDAASRLHLRRVSDGAAFPGSAGLPTPESGTAALRLVG